MQKAWGGAGLVAAAGLAGGEGGGGSGRPALPVSTTPTELGSLL